VPSTSKPIMLLLPPLLLLLLQQQRFDARGCSF
jgi:hypothetical protein